MIDFKRLHAMEQMMNERPCPFCGGKHRVFISLNESQSRPTSSIIMPDGEYICVGSEGACENFNDKAKNFLILKMSTLIADPFANIP